MKTMHYHTLILGAGAAGMNCAKKLYEYLAQKGTANPEKHIAVITRGLSLGTSRMSGSDKQTYYKLGTSATVADSAASFAESLTSGGCCHVDLALAEGIGSLRGFYNLVEVGVPFPHNANGAYIGYKTDHDPYERATSAGPKTSKFMSERLESTVRRYGIDIHDRQEVIDFIQADREDPERISAVVAIDTSRLSPEENGLRVFTADNIVLASGGPGGLFARTVYPKGQIGLHGIALRAGLSAENLTEFQFGLSSIKFRWNVSGSYMQSVPRIYSTDKNGENERDFLQDVFPSWRKMATATFLKGYQWPFDPTKIAEYGSSLIDLAVHTEISKGNRVFLDFLNNPTGGDSNDGFPVEDIDPEARDYLKSAGAIQSLPIERLEALNPPAMEIYSENNIDLRSEPLEIAVCAQHCNGGFAVDRWWQSNIKHTFVIGEMAGTHGIRRPGGSALNAGQVGAQRAAEFIANRYGKQDSEPDQTKIEASVADLSDRFHPNSRQTGLSPEAVLKELRQRTSRAAGHIRRLEAAYQAREEAAELCSRIESDGFRIRDWQDVVPAVQAEHLALTSQAVITAVHEMLEESSGSRGSHLVCSKEGEEIKSPLLDPKTGCKYRMVPENMGLRNHIQRLIFDTARARFEVSMVPTRRAISKQKPFERTWADFAAKRIYE